MSSRKRKNSAILENLSKRAKLLSQLWQPQDEVAESIERIQSNSSSPDHEINAIIGETPTEYLIDWANDPITEENFKPDWVSTVSIVDNYM